MLVSSHLLSEVAQSVDDVVVISHGNLRASGTLGERPRLGRGTGDAGSRRRTTARSAAALAAAGIDGHARTSGALWSSPASRTEAVGRVGERGSGSRSSELVAVSRSLEEVFFDAHRGRGRSEARCSRAELIKLRTTRTFYALAGVAVGISLLITILIASIEEPTQDSRPQRRLPERRQQPLHHDPRDRGDHRRVAPPDDHQLAARGARPDPLPRGEDARVRRRRALLSLAISIVDRDRRLRRSSRPRPADARVSGTCSS